MPVDAKEVFAKTVIEHAISMNRDLRDAVLTLAEDIFTVYKGEYMPGIKPPEKENVGADVSIEPMIASA